MEPWDHWLGQDCFYETQGHGAEPRWQTTRPSGRQLRATPPGESPRTYFPAAVGLVSEGNTDCRRSADRPVPDTATTTGGAIPPPTAAAGWPRNRLRTVQ